MSCQLTRELSGPFSVMRRVFENLLLIKFQMFGWTAIAAVIYVYLFCQNLTAGVTILPAIDSSIVTLTGVSQAGYPAGKGVSNVPPTNGERLVTWDDAMGVRNPQALALLAIDETREEHRGEKLR